MSEGPLILVVDDEAAIRRFLRISLEANGYQVAEANNGRDGIDSAARLRPDVVVLDLGLPDQHGLDVLRQLREWSRVPVVVLSVRDRDQDKVALLDAGADDYLTKPFSMGELLARLRTALRHTQPVAETAVFHAGPLAVDLAHRVVTVNDSSVRLTTTEYALLRVFIQNAVKVLTLTQLLREVWGPEYMQETHYLRVYLAHLRRKLEVDPANPKLLITEPGVGYRLTLDE
jgi:two-component system KDP operon response regulator KdpE